ncbi:MAG: tRNA preQ1(34) S-adenosylmethionine ribosyltransferase-isomerase QueA [candidate division WOR-3 bacterium]|nr:tRNA preQ1(34) S-adenosylmethionine ribosyltransferase-isomerase QueA [candidate division WOR-3 bacterium]
MKKSDFLFDLPKELIAQFPRERGRSKLFVLHRDSRKFEHRNFPDLIDYINPGDCLVVNNSKVIPARFYGYRESTGGKVEILLVEKISMGRWKTIVSPGKKARIGDVLIVEDKFKTYVEEIDKNTGERILRFEEENNLLSYGSVPLPPYIERLPVNLDKKRYQTIYAEKDGSVAAPTAGLHFNKEALSKFKEKGVFIVGITLHVGPGTFRPVRVENLEEHNMESERFEVTEEVASSINRVIEEGGEIFAVGTTTVRALETVALPSGRIIPKKGRTNLFIHPSFKFKITNHLLTNFHLPGSTLIMLASAFASRDLILKSYEEAILKGYRFYSYGDAMLIL